VLLVLAVLVLVVLVLVVVVVLVVRAVLRDGPVSPDAACDAGSHR
jgi:uncharacterized membrane protein